MERVVLQRSALQPDEPVKDRGKLHAEYTG